MFAKFNYLCLKPFSLRYCHLYVPEDSIAPCVLNWPLGTKMVSVCHLEEWQYNLPAFSKVSPG